VLPAPLLRIGALRVFGFDGLVFDSTVNTGFFPGRRIDMETPGTAVSDVAIEVDFVNAPLDFASVVAGTSFRVARATGTVAIQTVSFVAPNTVRWRTPSLALGTWTVRLAGEGSAFIRSAQGRRLDGELTQFPSGDGNEGGDTVFTIVVSREDLDLSDRFEPVDIDGRIVRR
jgi:hypothetical protein